MGQSTPNLNLFKPAFGEKDWLERVNGNNDILDALLGYGTLGYTDGGDTYLVQYAAPWGDDADNGRTWGTAKKTILGAFDELYGARRVGGTIFIAPFTQVGGEVTGQGLWFYGDWDNSVGPIPAGWRQLTGSVPINFVGVSNANGTQYGRVPILPGHAAVPYPKVDWSGPFIALSGMANGLRFVNLDDIYGDHSYGIDLTRNADGTLYVGTGGGNAPYHNNAIIFENVAARCTNIHSALKYNPIRVTNAFWIQIREDCQFVMEPEPFTLLNGAVSASTPGTSQSIVVSDSAPSGWPATMPFVVQVDQEEMLVTARADSTHVTVTRGYGETAAKAHSNLAAMRLGPDREYRAGILFTAEPNNDPTVSNNGSQVIKTEDVLLTYCNIHLQNVRNASIRRITQESCTGSTVVLNRTQPGILVDTIDSYDTPQHGAGDTGFSVIAQVRVIQSSTVASSHPDNVTVINPGLASSVITAVDGPANVIGALPAGYGAWLDSDYGPLGAVGVINRRLIGVQQDTSRRAGLAVAHHTNLIGSDPHGFVGGFNVYDQADVFGLLRAAENTSSNTTQIYSGAWNPTAPAAGESRYKGDFVFYGAWVRANKTWKITGALGADETGSPLRCYISAGAARFQQGPFVLATGNAYSEPGVPHYANVDWTWVSGYAKVSTGGASTLKLEMRNWGQICYPILFTVAAMTDAEAHETWLHLQTFPSQAPAGAMSTFPTQKLIAGGGLGVGNSAAATEVIGKAVTKKIQVFDEAGNSIGFVPVYTTIT